MDDEKEKWMKDVFESMKGSQRAKPKPELFAKIENRIVLSQVKVIPLRQWQYTVVAASFMLLINTTALFFYNQNNQMDYEEVVVVDTYNESLISSYQIYE
ncbi:MAG: hypothetical protein R2828_33615 [Saprospiraceae bacterium]